MIRAKERRERIEAEKQRLIDLEDEPNHLSNQKLSISDIFAVFLSALIVFGPVLLVLMAIMFFIFISM